MQARYVFKKPNSYIKWRGRIVIAILLYISFSAACTVDCWDWDEEMVVGVGWRG